MDASEVKIYVEVEIHVGCVRTKFVTHPTNTANLQNINSVEKIKLGK
ncbi:hypothetical protein NIES4075_04940 [Tolypothrix sp. NIES-4075]|nr:hypothetical protein NIES4075_04940 [Tolypothrix sp. NIES-4075]